MALPVALQVYSVRDDAARDFVGTMRAIREMGYDGVEFAGLYGHSADYVKGVIDALGLFPISAHVPLSEMLADPDKTFENYKKIGCPFVAVPYLPAELRPGTDRFEETVKNIARLGETAKKYEIDLLYHNHDFEFIKLDGEYGLDRLYREIPSSLLQTELDTCWVKVGGEEPAPFLMKYAGRAPVVHLKDFFMQGKLDSHPYALIGMEDTEKKPEKSVFEFRPLGKGMQDLPSLLDASVKAGAKWVVVEQDQPSMGLSALESVKVSREELKKLGW